MIGQRPICEGCARRRADDRARNDRYGCEAYPDGIPDAIVLGYADHRKPYKGDGGKRFEPADPTSAVYAESLFPSASK